MSPKLELLGHVLGKLKCTTNSTYEVTLLLVQLGDGCPCRVRPALLRVAQQLRNLVGGAPQTGLNLPAEPLDPTIFS